METEGSISDEYTMESNVFDYNKVKLEIDFYIKKYGTAIYMGQLMDNVISGGHKIREGFGIMRYQNNRVYEGCWHSDKRNGKGYERYANGNKYEGEFINSKANG